MALNPDLLAAFLRSGLLSEADAAVLQDASQDEPLTDQDVRIALAAFDATFPELAGLLDANVEGDPPDA